MSPSDMPSERRSAPPNWARARHAITARYVSRAFGNGFTPFRLEADILQSLGRLAVQMGGCSVVATAGREIALSDPRRGSVADGRELFEVGVGGGR